LVASAAAFAAEAFKDFGAEDVYLLRAPYGTQLIENGKFKWSLLDSQQSISAEFESAPIPLGLILSGSIELYTYSNYSAVVAARERAIRRTVPMFLLGAGGLFGLFETFAPCFSQPELNGDAGGTTLVVLPPIGNREKFGKLKSTDIGMFLNEKASNEKFAVGPTDTDDLQVIDGSNLSFGSFFAKLLFQTDCPWRIELALFPDSFIERIRKKPLAHQAMLAATINQLSLTCVRLSLTDKLNRSVNPAVKDHVLAVSLIAHGYRPGLVAVLETDRDEMVLPAKAIHRILYDLEVCEKIGDKDFFPAIFRPSFAVEPSYYFLSRPYFRTGSERSSIADQIAHITSEADKHSGCKGHFASTNQSQLEKSLELASSVSEGTSRKVCVGRSAFIKGGCIAIQPLEGKTA
jgi:hypothetical protein